MIHSSHHSKWLSLLANRYGIFNRCRASILLLIASSYKMHGSNKRETSRPMHSWGSDSATCGKEELKYHTPPSKHYINKEQNLSEYI